MRVISTCIAILIAVSVSAQQKDAVRSIVSSISSNVNYPENFRKNKKSGTVQIEFVIDRRGHPTEFKVLKEFLGASEDVKDAIMKVRPDDLLYLAERNGNFHFFLAVEFYYGKYSNDDYAGHPTAYSLPPVSLLAYATSVELDDRDIKSIDGSATSFNTLLQNADQNVSLEIKDRGLTSIPQEVFLLKNIDYLDLEKNEITSLPERLTELHKLEQLNLTDNKVNTLPRRFYDLHALKILSVKQNKLTTFPEEILRMQSLEILDLSDNKIAVIPKEISALKNLTTLSLRNNDLTAIPPEVRQLKNLQYLDIEDNSLPPEEVEKLKRKMKKVWIQF